jgi:hypothetical protein
MAIPDFNRVAHSMERSHGNLGRLMSRHQPPYEIHCRSLPIAAILQPDAVKIVVSRKNVSKLHGLALHRTEDRGALSRAPEDLA